MPTLRILCLANSRKHGGRCVAGLRLDGQGWVRLVSGQPDGTLRHSSVVLDDRSHLKTLDVIDVAVAGHQPKGHQRENWLIGKDRWTLVRRPASEADLAVIGPHVVDGPLLFGNDSDRVAADAGARSSLTLIRVKGLRFRIQAAGGNRKTRACFRLDGAAYSLRVTDDAIEADMENLKDGTYPVEACTRFRPNEETLVTVSLGEPFDGYCYKLAAAIIPWSRVRDGDEQGLEKGPIT